MALAPIPGSAEWMLQQVEAAQQRQADFLAKEQREKDAAEKPQSPASRPPLSAAAGD